MNPTGYLYSHGAPTWAASLFLPGWGQFCQGRIAEAGKRLAGWLICLLVALLVHPLCWLGVALMHGAAAMEAWGFHNRALLQLARRRG